MKKIQKTNAMRFLDQHKVEYEAHTYEHKDGDPVDGVHVANMLHQPVEAVYKTLVTQANTKEYLVYMLPVEKELDLKKITGYIRGGCSPLGMKKQFRTFIEKDCLNQDKIYFSAGKIGMQIEMDPKTLMDLIHVQAGDITKE